MRDRRYWFGVVASVAWVLVAMGFVIWKGPAEKINEWGDFFAGFAAPLAFLWLVLGYLQQGEELRLSTDALRLQADELKQSVEQQKQLAESAKLQYAEAIRNHQDSVRPRLEFVGGGVEKVEDGELLARYEVSNVGASIANVRFIAPSGCTFDISSIARIDQGMTYRLSLRFLIEPKTGDQICMTYVDRTGRSGTQFYEFNYVVHHCHILPVGITDLLEPHRTNSKKQAG